MPTLNKTRYAILGVLSIKPGSGYDMRIRFPMYYRDFRVFI